MKRWVVGIFVVMLSLWMVSGVNATPVNTVGGTPAGSELSLQTILNNITSPYPGISSVNVNADQLALDEKWQISAAGGAFTTMIIELAGQASSQTFGVYDVTNSSIKVQVFDGAATAGTQATFGITDNGSVKINLVDTGVNFAGNQFGFYINTSTGFYYSQTSLNVDAFDHMVAFQGKGDLVKLPGVSAGPWASNEYILAFENARDGGDWDYQDMVLMVESVSPAAVPEPATLLLLGFGLVGLAGIRRKFKSSKS